MIMCQLTSQHGSMANWSKLFDNHNMLVTTIYVNYLSLFDHRSLGDVEISSDSIIGTVLESRILHLIRCQPVSTAARLIGGPTAAQQDIGLCNVQDKMEFQCPRRSHPVAR